MSKIVTKTSSISFDILKIALVLGLLGDVLLRAKPWGLNVLLFNVAFVGAFAVLQRRSDASRLNRQAIALMAAQLFFAAMFVWRDSMELRIADTVAIVAILSIQLLPRMGVVQRLAGAFHFVIAFVWSAFNSFFAPAALLTADIEWAELPDSGWRKHLFAAGRGVAIALPLVLVFGGLFVAADAAYEGMVARVLNIDPATIFTHALLFAVFGWLSMGYLRGAVIKPIGSDGMELANDDGEMPDAAHSTFSEVAAEEGELPVTLPDDRSVIEHLSISDPPNAPAETAPVESAPDWKWADLNNTILPASFTLGATEVAVILGAMNLLFLSFVIVEVPYLFGGMELVQTTPDFKLAEYARRGFGELVTVSALVLPMLLVGQWLIRREAAHAQTLFKILASTQIALLFVVMASAVQRLALLTGSLGYGMTTVRLYPMIFMSWLAVVFVWFGVTVLRGYRRHFAWGALWSAFLVLGAAHVLNPDAFIVRTNLALMHGGRSFDAVYNARLSDDALPTLIEGFPTLNSEDDKRAVLHLIAERYCEKREENDLRSWNLSRSQALSAVDSDQKLAAAIGTCGVEMFAEPDVDELLR